MECTDEMTPQELGYFGERLVAGTLVMRGIPVKRGGVADLTIYDNTPLEVKTARLHDHANGRQGYQFCLERDGRDGLEAPVVVLLCWRGPFIDPAMFIIPEEEVKGIKRLTIPNTNPSEYQGKYAVWYNNWDLIGGEAPSPKLQPWEQY